MFPLLFSLFLGTVFVSGQPAQPSQETQVSEEQSIGTIVEIEGSASAVSQNRSARELAAGDAVYKNDTITTSGNSTVQIEFLDESLFTISEKTILKIDQYLYDETAKTGTFSSSVARGVFRYVSGKIEKINPEKVNIKIPSGTIGIRGTIVVGEIDGENCLVALEPEEGNTSHRIVVFNEAEGKRQEIEITKPGFATRIEGKGKAPQPVFQLPQENQKRFQERLPQPPQFPSGTKPGTPERYQHLFDPSQRMRNPQMQKQQNQQQPGKRNEQAQGPGRKDEPRQNPGGPQGPNGPQGPQSGNFANRENPKGPQSFQSQQTPERGQANPAKNPTFGNFKHAPFEQRENSGGFQAQGRTPQPLQGKMNPRQNPGGPLQKPAPQNPPPRPAPEKQ